MPKAPTAPTAPTIFRSDPALRVYEKVLVALNPTAANRVLIRAIANQTSRDFAHSWSAMRYRGLPVPCLKYLSLKDLTFANLDLSGTDWRKATLTNVNMANSNLAGSLLTGLRAEKSTFCDADLRYTAASKMRLVKTNMLGVVCDYADTRCSSPLPSRQPQAIQAALTPLVILRTLPTPAPPNGLILTGPRPLAWLRDFEYYVRARYAYVLLPAKGEYQTLMAQLRWQQEHTQDPVQMHSVHLFEDYAQPLPSLSNNMPLNTLQCMYVPSNASNRETRSDVGKTRKPRDEHVTECER